MLKRLHVKNYVLIDSLDIDFPAGLIIITGQTGAGKSIILGALSLVMGGRADVNAIGEASGSCIVEAEFSTGDDPAVKKILDDNELDWTGGDITVRRVLSRTGRSRSFLNDEPVSAKVLSALSDRLLDIHSQHATILLGDSHFQLSMLDHYAGNAALLKYCAEAYSILKQLEARHTDVSARLSRLSEERDYNEARYNTLEAAALREGELEELEAEQKKLSNAEEIKSTLLRVGGLFCPSEDTSMEAALKEAVKQLSKISVFLPEAGDLSARLESARLELADISSSVSDMEGSVDVSEDRLQAVEDRMSLIYGLLRRYSCSSEKELLAVKDELASRLFDTTALAEERTALEKRIVGQKAGLDRISENLHEVRKAAAEPFARDIEASIRSLELENAVFKVVLDEAPQSAAGTDAVRFLFSATGRNPVEISRYASGGEMSRIMLCLKAMMARYTKMPSMIFDEIDSGVSGSAADKIGSLICSMGEHMQVFAITHLPQVAAKGEAHYLVEKEVSGDAAVRTAIKRIAGDERVMEVARLLSASSVTAEAIANARSLIGEAWPANLFGK